MNNQIIASKYPVSYDNLKQWVIGRLKTTTFLGNNEIFSKITESIIDPTLATIINSSSKELLDFFDSYDVYLCVIGSNDHWTVAINRQDIGNTYISRNIAHMYGCEHCFEMLERKLTTNK